METGLKIETKQNIKPERKTENKISFPGNGAGMSIQEKLAILTDSAKFDVACTSSGVDRKGNGKDMGNCVAAVICHSFAGDGRCISLLKILMTNECVFDCKYCQNRCSNDIPRATFTPEEIVLLPTFRFHFVICYVIILIIRWHAITFSALIC